MKIDWTEAYQIVGEIIDYLSQCGVDSGILCQHYEPLVDIIVQKEGLVFSTFQWKWISQRSEAQAPNNDA